MGQLVETGARCCDCRGFVAERGGVWFGATNEERRRDEPFISRYPTGILYQVVPLVGCGRWVACCF